MARSARKTKSAPTDTAAPEAPASEPAVAPVAAAPVEAPAPEPEAPKDQADTEVDELIAASIEVTALQPSRWRAGRRFTAEPTVIPLDELSEAEEAAILADPLLSVRMLAAEV